MQTAERQGTQEEAASPRLERRAERRESWRGFLHAVPAYMYLVLFFVLPLIIVFVFLASPTAIHGIVDAGVRAGLAPWKKGEERR